MLSKKKDVFYIQTEGVNFGILKDLDFINHNSVASNDIHAISQKYGVILIFMIDLSSSCHYDQGNSDTVRCLRRDRRLPALIPDRGLHDIRWKY